MKDLKRVFKNMKTDMDTEIIVGKPIEIRKKDVMIIPILDLSLGTLNKGSDTFSAAWTKINPKAIIVIYKEKLEVFSFQGCTKINDIKEKLSDLLDFDTYKNLSNH